MIQDSSARSTSEKVRALITQAREQAAAGNLRRAEDVLEDARDTATAAQDNAPEMAEVRSLAFAESALLYQQLGNLHAARAFFRKAASFAEDAPDERAREGALMRTSTLINLIGVHARLKEVDDGRQAAAQALELLGRWPDMQGAPFLRLGALQNGAAVELQAGAPDRAGPMLEEAVGLGQAMLSEGTTQIMPQVLDAMNQLARVRANMGEHDGARVLLEQGARLAEASYEGGNENAWPLVVNARLQLAQLDYGARRLADAEDHLWKAVEVTRDVRPILQAATFYLDLLKLPDPDLEEGGLPRPEVIEAWDEILARLEATALTEDARGLLAARFELLARGDIDPSRRWENVKPDDPALDLVAKELLRGLRADIDWFNQHSGTA